MPEQSGDNACIDLMGKTFSGWEEIRSALFCVEELRNNGNQPARVEVVERSKESSLRVTFRTPAELDGYLRSRTRKRMLEGVGDSLSLEKLEEITEVYTLQNDIEDVQGRVLLARD